MLSDTEQQEFKRRQLKRSVTLFSALIGLSGILYILALIRL